MARSDYAHWNEEQDLVWWQEEGKHHSLEDPPDPDDESWRDEPEPDVEHDTRDDCLRDGCFSQARDGYPWRCDLCGDEFPVGWKPGDVLPESLKGDDDGR